MSPNQISDINYHYFDGTIAAWEGREGEGGGGFLHPVTNNALSCTQWDTRTQSLAPHSSLSPKLEQWTCQSGMGSQAGVQIN